MVTWRATRKQGWTFGGWSGAVTSTNAETQLTITDDAIVNATFVQDQYEIEIDVISLGKSGVGGAVALNPNQGSYVYTDTVTRVA